MSSVFISIGQCGNQISKTLIDYLKSNQTNQTSYLFNHFDNKFRFVNLDSEIKVINNLLNEHKDVLREENLINTKCGRGSNWASGYSGLNKDGSMKIIEQTLEAIRRESERCDFLLNFVILHSISGGTGSGCGSKLIEKLRDEYDGKAYLFTQSVAPFKSGEMPLQHYNNLLCLSYLQEFTDFIGLYQNDDVLNAIEKLNFDKNKPINPSISSKTGLLPFNSSKLKSASVDDIYTSVSLSDMNKYIVKCLLNSIYPIDSISLEEQSIGMEWLELERLLCANPNLKIVEFYNMNNSINHSIKSLYDKKANKSNPLLKKLLSSMPRYKSELFSEQYKSINSLIIARGNQEFNEYNNEYVIGQLKQDSDYINKCLNPVEWNPFSIDFWTSKTSLNDPLEKPTKVNSLTVCTNRNKCVDYLKEVLEKSKEKFKYKAYLHWYEKFDINQDYFENAFENLNSIINSYESMTS